MKLIHNRDLEYKQKKNIASKYFNKKKTREYRRLF